MGDFVVYKVIYGGDKHPPFYIGSTSKSKLLSGYRGSISSLKWKDVVKREMKENKELYSFEILSEHTTRQEALDAELEHQRQESVVTNPLYYNEAYAIPSGFFGRDVSGKNNPRFGKTCPENVAHAAREASMGMVVVSTDNGDSWTRVTKEEFWSNRDKYTTPKGEFNISVTYKTRERVAQGTHHFCDPEVQRKIHDKRRESGYIVTEEQREKLSISTKQRFSDWKNKMFTEETRSIWVQALCLYDLYVHHCYNDFTPTGKIKREKSSRLKEDFYRLTGMKISTGMLAKVTKKFKNGWVPHEDEKYMEWINESKENLE